MSTSMAIRGSGRLQKKLRKRKLEKLLNFTFLGLQLIKFIDEFFKICIFSIKRKIIFIYKIGYSDLIYKLSVIYLIKY